MILRGEINVLAWLWWRQVHGRPMPWRHVVLSITDGSKRDAEIQLLLASGF